jgi:uncharacterized membrane protein/biotin operon repressor
MSRLPRWVSESLLLGSLCSLLGTSCNGQPLDGDSPPGSTSVSGGFATDPLTVRPVDRLLTAIDAQDRVALPGHRHPLARAEFETGAAPSDYLMERMMLVLRPDEVQEQALQALLHAQHDAASPAHHQWLTAEAYAEKFGISEHDVAVVATWLRSQGMTVDEVSSGGRLLQFTGTAAHVEAAFHTPMRAYLVDGEVHHANASDPEIPRALASVVSGVVSLHDFQSKPSSVVKGQSGSENTWYYNGIQQSALVPQDLVKIYNVAPLYTASLDGAGQNIAVVGRSNIDVANVRTFRTTYGLPANDPQVIVNGKDPGILCGGDEAESYLDVEWAGALAKKATVKFVVSASTSASDGIYLAAQYAVNHNVAPILSLSYGLCEKGVGTSGNLMLNSLWQQAATQGMSVFVASMDSGAAGCDQMNAAVATGGLAINGLGSTPFNTSVGGTQFDDATNRTPYWSATNDPTTQASALGYIPEMVWNESASGLFASGGGVSTIYAKPVWQFGLGVLADGKRSIPDVAMPAAIQDAYRIYGDNQFMGVGGTSAATPVFASIMALVLQKVGQQQGLVNPVLYALAYNQDYSGGAAVFHDIVKGTNTVPGVTGYNAGPGYDMATGLGSVDATQLVNHWSEGTSLPNFQIAGAASSASVLPGASTTATFTVKLNNGFNSAVSFSVTGVPAGVTAGFAPASLTSSGTITLTLTAASSATPGTYALTITGTSGSTSHSAALALTVINAPTLALTFAPATLDVAAGASGTTTVTTTRNSAFSAAVSLAITGLPQGVTAKLSPTSITAPGAGSSVITATVSATMAGGTYPVTVTATGGGTTKAVLLAINVLPAPSFSLTLSPTAISVVAGNSGSTTATTIRTTTFNSAVTLKVTGMPAGITPSTGLISAPGSGISTLGVTVGSSVAAGSYALTVTATGGGVTKTAPLALTVLPPPGFTLTLSPTSVSVSPGGSGTITAKTLGTDNFNSAVTLKVTGMPAGITVSSGLVSAPGSGSSTVAVTAGSSVAAGSCTLTVTATGGGVTKTATLALTVLPPPSFALTVTPASVSVAPGSAGTFTAKITGTSNFSSAVTVSATGLPAGVTVSSGQIGASGSGSSSLSVAVASSVAGGSYPLTVTATGGGVTKTAPLTLLVPSTTLSMNVTTLVLSRGNTVTTNVTTAVLGGFSSAVVFAVQGLPSGVTTTFTPSSLPAPGNGSTVLKLSAASTAAIGPATLTIKATAGSTVRTLSLGLTVK